jgi:hypothetical protein
MSFIGRRLESITKRVIRISFRNSCNRTNTMTNNTLPVARRTNIIVQRFPKMIRKLRMLWGGRKQEILGSTSVTVRERTDASPSLEESSRSSAEDCTSCCSGTRRIVPFPILLDDDEDSYVMECMICLEGIREDVHDCQDVLPCGHIFHRCCLNSWRFQRESCPTCRHGLEYYEMTC